MEKLKFYDLRKKKSFLSDEYKLVKKNVRGKPRTFAVTTAPSGLQSWRIVSAKQ